MRPLPRWSLRTTRTATTGLVLASRRWHPGVIGIVASRMVERLHRPTVMIALDGPGEGKGSARSIPAFNLYEAIRDCSEHLVRFGGHRMAAGCSIRAERVDGFREAFNARAKRGAREEDLVPEVRIDLEMELRHADHDLVRMLRHAGPFGAGNATPVFAARGVSVADHKVVGQGHLKMTLAAFGTKLEAIGFGMGERCREPGFGTAAAGRGVQAGGKPLQRPHHRPGAAGGLSPGGVGGRTIRFDGDQRGVRGAPSARLGSHLPPKTAGGGWVWARSGGAPESLAAKVRRPPPRPSPTNCVGEGERQNPSKRDRILPSPRRNERGGAGGGAPRRRSSRRIAAALLISAHHESRQHRR